MYQKAILATDLSPASDHVIQCLKGVNNFGIREIVLTYALGIKHLDDMKHELFRMVEPHLQRQRAELRAMGFAADICAPPGLPNEELLRVAAEHKADLMIVGSRGHSLAAGMLLGSTAHALLQRSPLPVLIMRVHVGGSAEHPECFCDARELTGHVLYPTDFSDNAELAFGHLKELVKGGAKRVTLLHVQDRVRIQTHLESMLEEFNRIDTERLERRRRDLLSLGATEVDVKIAFGHPTEEVLKTSREGISLIVMGSQGRGFFQEVFMGSTSHNVVRHAPVPVLVVPMPR